MPRSRRILTTLFVAAVIVFVGMQAVRPSLGSPAGPQQAIAVPPHIQEILDRRCYACHSDQPRLVWFDHVAPAYWLVAKDVKDARAHLNFSELGAKPAAVQRAELFEAVNQIQLGAMPLPRYLAAHRGAGVTAEELADLKAYLAPFAAGGPTAGGGDVVAAPSAEPAKAASLSLNGVPFFPDYKSWRLLSTTDRGDNKTLRMIAGNDVAMKAVEARATNPWPDGSVFAKITVASVDDGAGHISAGKFVQVEFMVKDAKKYAETKGWGYARYKGDDLKPYGADAHFDRECVGCHEPMRDNDYVYTTPIPMGGAR
jgi:Cytochrome P460/Haem-binding domain